LRYPLVTVNREPGWFATAFGGGAAPAPAPLPVAPLVDPAQVASQQKAAEQAYLQNNARGRASTILTSPLGTSQDNSNNAVATLGGSLIPGQ
jgi:hypothetical protein